jgi:hypothetical protein
LTARRSAARLARPPGRVRLARTANTCVRAVGGFCLFLLAFELRRQGVGTAGLGLLLVAVRQFRGRPHQGEEASLPKWMGAIDRFGPGQALGGGAALAAANPKNLLLAIGGAAAIAQTGISGGRQAIAYALDDYTDPWRTPGTILLLHGNAESSAALTRRACWNSRSSSQVG